MRRRPTGTPPATLPPRSRTASTTPQILRTGGVGRCRRLTSIAVVSARLYAATGDGDRPPRCDERRLGGRALAGRTAARNASPSIPPMSDTLYAGLRTDGVRRSDDGGRHLGRTRALPEPGGLLTRRQRCGRSRLRGHRAEPRSIRSDDQRRELARARSAAPLAVPADVELSAEAVDVTRALDRSEPARRRLDSSSESSSAG